LSTPARDDLWQRLIAMPRPSKVVDFPRTTPDGKPMGQIAMWVLSQSEQEEAAAAANNRALALIKNDKGEVPKDEAVKKGFADVYNNCAADEVLYRACRKVGQLDEAFFPSIQLLRTKLSVDEIGVLMSHYYTVQEELGPIVTNLTPPELNALIERLARSGEMFPLDLLSPGALKALVISMARRLTSSSTATSSPGEPPASDSSAVAPQANQDAPADASP
jgi:hypothetical protein